MSYTYVDGRALEAKQVAPFPLFGGLDLITDKLSVSPGTLTDCLNYEVTTNQGYTQSYGIMEYGGIEYHMPYFVYINIIQIADDAEMLLKPGGTYTSSSGVTIKVSRVKNAGSADGDLTNYEVFFRVISGTFSEDISINLGDYSVTLSIGAPLNIFSYSDKDGYIQSLSVNNPEQRIPGVGQVNAVWELNDNIYVARDAQADLTISIETLEESGTFTNYNNFVPESIVAVSLDKAVTVTGVESNVTFLAEVVELVEEDSPNPAEITILYQDFSDKIKYNVLDKSERYSTYDEVVAFLQAHTTAAAAILTPKVYDASAVDTVNDEDIWNDFTGTAELKGAPVDPKFSLPASPGSNVYKMSSFEERTRDPYWESVDLGKEIQFHTGTTVPITAINRAFADNDFPIQALGVEASTIEETSGATTWQDMNLVRETGSPEDYAFTSVFLGSSYTSNTWLTSGTLTAKRFNIRLPSHTIVSGIEVKVRHQFFTSYPTNTPEATANLVRLVGVEGSVNKADNTVVIAEDPSAFDEVVYGGDSDKWGLSAVPKELIESDEFGVEINYRVRLNVNSPVTSIQPRISLIEITVYFQDGTEKVYFYDTVAGDDVAEATLVHYVKTDGEWDTDDAEGVITLYDIDDESAVVKGLQIRNADDGDGNLIAVTDSAPSTVRLPSSSALRARTSKIVTIKENFFSNEQGTAIYGATGVSPAFFFDGRYFAYIRTPVSADKDIPKYVLEHNQHLLLGYASGQVLNSVGGLPLNFDPVKGAREWGFGDQITGLQNLGGNATGVFCRTSTHAFIGNSVLSFNTQVISKASGALDYTVTSMGQPLYCDLRGITTVNTTDTYGDFNWGRVSKFVSPWLQPRLQDDCVCGTFMPSIALPIRNKNQYRLLFGDGTILVMTMFDVQGSPSPMLTFANYDNSVRPNRFVPTCGLSTVLSTGREVTLTGTASGKLYVLDSVPGIVEEEGRNTYNCFLTLNPFDGDTGPFTMKYNQAYIHGAVMSPVELTATAGVNYLVPEANSYEDTQTLGYPDTEITADKTLVPATCSVNLPSVTDGYSMKISSVADDLPPHVLQAITMRPKITSDKTAAPRRHP